MAGRYGDVVRLVGGVWSGGRGVCGVAGKCGVVGKCGLVGRCGVMWLRIFVVQGLQCSTLCFVWSKVCMHN